MRVERARSSDAPRIREIAELAREKVDPEAELLRTFAELWVAREYADGPVESFLLAWNAADEVHLVDIATHPAARRRGFGRALMGVLLTHARERQARLILLEVRTSNSNAIALYRAMGFSMTGTRRDYYENPREDGLEMRVELDPVTGRPIPLVDEISETNQRG